MTVTKIIIISVISFVITIFLFFQFGGAAKNYFLGNIQELQAVQKELETQKQRNQEVLQEYTQAQIAVRQLSQKISSLRQEADLNRAEAQRALQRQHETEKIVASLEQKITELELLRKQLQKVKTLQEARDEFVKRLHLQ